MIINKRKEGVEAVFKKVGVLGVFVKDHFGNLDVTDFTVKDSGFAENVNAFYFFNVFDNFTKDVIGGKT